MPKRGFYIVILACVFVMFVMFFTHLLTCRGYIILTAVSLFLSPSCVSCSCLCMHKYVKQMSANLCKTRELMKHSTIPTQTTNTHCQTKWWRLNFRDFRTEHRSIREEIRVVEDPRVNGWNLCCRYWDSDALDYGITKLTYIFVCWVGCFNRAP